MAAKISALEVHPSLEALLHILNGDLASAHFLVRHMESPPAYEGMALHALLHRVEGDIENARCWYLDIMHSDMFAHVWAEAAATITDDSNGSSNTKMSENEDVPKPEKARLQMPGEVTEFLDRIARLRRYVLKASVYPLPQGVQREKEESELTQISAREVSRLRGWCEGKFGTGKIGDAREAYVGVGEQRGEISEAKAGMTLKGEGFRSF